MAIKKKGEKSSHPGFPPTFVRFITQAATYQVTSKFFEDQFKSVKGDLEAYLEQDNCPVTAAVGEKGPKVPGVAALSFSQPARVDNDSAKALIVERIQNGTLDVSNLLELISTVNKDALEKIVDAETFTRLAPPSDRVTITLRAEAGFKEEVTSRLTDTVLPIFTHEE